MVWLKRGNRFLKCFFLLGLVYQVYIVTDAQMMKIWQDLHIIFLRRLVTILSVPEKKCVFLCDKLANGESNFRRSNDLKHICECFQATEDFWDSRHVAPYTDVIVSFVNSKHQFSLLSISKNYHLQRYNFCFLNLVELLEKKLHREF